MKNLSPAAPEPVYMPNEPSRFEAHDTDRVLAHCESLSASDITIQTNECIFAESFGSLIRVTRRKLSNTEVGEMINGIYGSNATTQILSGQDIDTHYEFRPTRTERYRYRVNATGCQVDGNDGIQITLRAIPYEPANIESLGLEPSLLANYAPLQGCVYVSGATGSGKSTLLASIIKNLAQELSSNRKILTYESPIEFVFDNVKKPSAIVSQSEVPRHIPSFARGVRNALRRKPHLILVGEARDTETINAVLEAALTGHPVYTTVHANGVAETIRRLVTSFPQEERQARTVDIIETVRLIVWQQLVPSIDGKRTALREFLVFDEQVREILLESDLDQVIANTRRLLYEKGQPMVVDAERKFKAGLISERTYQLVTKGAKKL